MDDLETKRIQVSLHAIQRMPYYLQYLRTLQGENVAIVSAAKVAEKMRLNAVQVRKDFAAVSIMGGNPKVGFDVNELIKGIEEIMGFNSKNEAVLVGVGSLGTALLSYKGFDDYSMHIVAAFDNNQSVIGTEINKKHILSADKISDICRRMNIRIGIITVPTEQAQIVCDQLVAGGIRAIWNFAPVHLSAPDNILIQSENMAASLALLSKHLKEKF